jgi:hypothetical protein
MMTTMLTVTIFTLITIFIVLKRLLPPSQKPPSNDTKDAHNNNNNNHSSSIEDDSDEPASLPLSSKNCYITLVQHDDDTTNDYSLTKRVSNQNSNGDIQNQSPRYDTSSTNNVLCLSDEQNRILNKHPN